MGEPLRRWGARPAVHCIGGARGVLQAVRVADSVEAVIFEDDPRGGTEEKKRGGASSEKINNECKYESV